MSAIHHPRTIVASAAAALLVSGAALAGPFSMTWDATGDGVDAFTYDPSEFGEVNDLGGGLTQYVGGWVGDGYELSWDCVTEGGGAGLGSGGAVVDSSMVVTNTSDTTQTYSMLMTLSLDDIISAPSAVNGSVGLTVTNNDFFGGDATIAAASQDSIYKAFLDLVDPFADPAFATLWDDPYSVTASGPLASANDDDEFGDPTPLVGPGVTDNIAIMLTFELSAGDSASVSGILSVVPAPGAMALLGLAGLAGSRRRQA